MMRALKYAVILCIVGAVAAGAALGSLYWWFNQPRVTMQEADLLAPVLFEVPRGSNGRQLTQKLAAEGYIEHQQFNYIAARLFLDADHIRAGVYAIHPADSPRSIWQRVTTGQQHLFQLTFIEGSEFSEWRESMAQHDYLEQVTEGLSDEDIMAMIDPDAPSQHPEGLFFPDTYRFTAGTSDLQILRKAYRRMVSTLDQLWQERQQDLPISAPYQALILASIVEKETGAAHERELVASVFVNRLNTGMRLQSDPTIIYGLGDDYRGVIYRSDINQYTPYNTYRINGLPPTPIAMPGYDAIRATLNPEQSDYFYFVSSNDGQHIFSRTLEEHNRAVYQYQRNR